MSKDKAPALIVYRENKPHVRGALGAGKVDYIDLTHWSFQDRFFAFVSASGFLQFAQICFPTPRAKEEAPVSLSDRMRAATEAAFRERLPQTEAPAAFGGRFEPSPL